MAAPEQNNSYYEATVSRPQYAALDRSMDTDVCIIGGGYTGLSSALHLANRGLRVVLLEAGAIGSGASGRNGGQLYGGQRQDVDWLEGQFDHDTARRLWALGNEARDLVKSLIDTHSIDCDYTPGIVIAAHRARHVDDYHELADKLSRNYQEPGIEKLDRDGLAALIGSHAYHGGYVDWNNGHLHPLKLALGMARAAHGAGADLFEHSRAESIEHRAERHHIRTALGEVRADRLIIATNGYLGNLVPGLAAYIMPINNFIVTTESLSEQTIADLCPRRVAVADSRFVVNYFRFTRDNRLLFGGGENYSRHLPKDIAARVRPRLVAVYPQLAEARLDHTWGGTLAITFNRMPHVGHLTPTCVFAQGFSGQGVAMCHLAGQLLAEALTGKSERFELMSRVPVPRFPGGRWLRWPGLVAGMSWYSLLDRL
ncbi:MAG: FAD-binding oxidoreductase [Pseudomonadales bacterium]